ncbi:helix-turn-helix transcriptional regulator [Cellulomonas sp. 179-A 9B4 NHS]|uniref:helix-turn-helix transcriptional regulator n=1 Tax=Cellulomonas sp. 179-A 9B4 NHS TaxID=3142379 RepID=UPI0039A2753C
MSRLITTEQAAALVGVSPSTWRAYLARRRQHGKGTIPEPVEYHGRTAMYDEDAVRAWHATRPGRGARTDLAEGST